MCDLAELWVERTGAGKGVGSKLFRLTPSRARDLGARRWSGARTPALVGFYEKTAGRRVRDTISSSFDFVTPVTGIDLEFVRGERRSVL